MNLGVLIDRRINPAEAFLSQFGKVCHKGSFAPIKLFGDIAVTKPQFATLPTRAEVKIEKETCSVRGKR